MEKAPQEKIDESKEKTKEQQESGNVAKKDDAYDTSEVSDDEHKKIDAEKQKLMEKELNQVIYITITETPTNILFYCPSTKYLTLKNGKYYYNNLLYIYR